MSVLIKLSVKSAINVLNSLMFPPESSFILYKNVGLHQTLFQQIEIIFMMVTPPKRL